MTAPTQPRWLADAPIGQVVQAGLPQDAEGQIAPLICGRARFKPLPVHQEIYQDTELRLVYVVGEADLIASYTYRVAGWSGSLRQIGLQNLQDPAWVATTPRLTTLVLAVNLMDVETSGGVPDVTVEVVGTTSNPVQFLAYVAQSPTYGLGLAAGEIGSSVAACIATCDERVWWGARWSCQIVLDQRMTWEDVCAAVLRSCDGHWWWSDGALQMAVPHLSHGWAEASTQAQWNAGTLSSTEAWLSANPCFNSLGVPLALYDECYLRLARPATLFADDFNRADGAVGGGWTVAAAGFTIASNTLRASAACQISRQRAGEYQKYYEASYLQSQRGAVDTFRAGIVAGLASAASMWNTASGGWCALVTNAGTVQLYRAGLLVQTWTLPSRPYLELNAVHARTRRLGLYLQPTTVYVYWDGELVGSYEYPAGVGVADSIGIVGDYGASGYGQLDDYAVRPTPYATSGTWTSPVHDVSVAGEYYGASQVYAEVDLHGGLVLIEARVSKDGGGSWGSYTAMTNGGALPGMVADESIAQLRVQVRLTLTAPASGHDSPVVRRLGVYVAAHPAAWPAATVQDEGSTVILDRPDGAPDFEVASSELETATVAVFAAEEYRSAARTWEASPLYPVQLVSGRLALAAVDAGTEIPRTMGLGTLPVASVCQAGRLARRWLAQAARSQVRMRGSEAALTWAPGDIVRLLSAIGPTDVHVRCDEVVSLESIGVESRGRVAERSDYYELVYVSEDVAPGDLDLTATRYVTLLDDFSGARAAAGLAELGWTKGVTGTSTESYGNDADASYMRSLVGVAGVTFALSGAAMGLQLDRPWTLKLRGRGRPTAAGGAVRFGLWHATRGAAAEVRLDNTGAMVTPQMSTAALGGSAPAPAVVYPDAWPVLEADWWTLELEHAGDGVVRVTAWVGSRKVGEVLWLIDATDLWCASKPWYSAARDMVNGCNSTGGSNATWTVPTAGPVILADGGVKTFLLSAAGMCLDLGVEATLLTCVGSAGLVTRLTARGTYYALVLDPVARAVSLVKSSAGTVTTLATTTMTVSLPAVVRITAEYASATAATLTGYVNGVSVVTATDSASAIVAPGMGGLYVADCSSSGRAIWDGLRLWNMRKADVHYAQITLPVGTFDFDLFKQVVAIRR